MATGRGDGPNRPDAEEWEDERSRSLLNATWFRVLIVVIVVAAVAAVAVPYVMELTSTPRPVARVPAAPAKPDAATPAAPPPQTSAPAATATAPAAPPPAAPAAPAAPVAQPPKPEPQRAEPAPAKPDAAKPASKGTAARQPQATKPAPAGSGDLWVQVGAFRDQATAQRLAAALKEKGFNATESTTTPGAPATSAAQASAGGGKTDRYDVVVSGAQAPELVQKLNAKGLSAEHTADGVIVRPSLPLRDAISLSNDLRTEGFKVTVRRVGGGAAPAPAARTGETLHRVRVGAFPDRAAARATAQKLEALGYKPFIAQGP